MKNTISNISTINPSAGNFPPMNHVEVQKFFQLSCHVYLKDLSGVFIQCNISLAQSYGLKNCSAVIGLSDKDFFRKKDIRLLKINHSKVVSSLKPLIIIENSVFLNKDVSSMLSIKFPIISGAGKLVSIMGISFALNDPESKITCAEKIAYFLSSIPLIFDKSTLEKPPFLEIKNISRREKQCLIYLLHGLSTKSMATLLKLSTRTVDFYIANMKRKFKCQTRLKLVARAPFIMQQFHVKSS